MPNDSPPFLDDVVDQERVEPVYQVRGSSLLVQITNDNEILVTNANGELLPGVSLAVNDHMLGKERNAASAREVAEWLRTNTREVGIHQ